MVRILPIKDFSARKKILLLQSNLQRQTLRVQVATAQQSFAQYKRKFAILGASSVAFSAALSIAGFFVAKRKPREGKSGGWMSKVFSGISFFNQIKGLFTRLKSAGDSH